MKLTTNEQTTESMNILQVVEACTAGVGRHVRSLCKGLVNQGHRVTVAYAPHRADEAFRRFVIDGENKIRFVPLELERTVSPTSDLRGTIQLLRLIKSNGSFDVVHGHSSKGGAIARIAGLWAGLPTVYTPHGLVMAYPEFSRAESAIYTTIERALGHLATSRLIAVSEDEREFVIELGLLPRKRIALVKNGVEDHDFDCSSKEALCESVSDKPLTFGSIMRFSREKAPGCLVEAFVRVAKTLPQVPMRLVIAGDGELFAETKRRVEASECAEKISLLGWKTDVKEVLRGFDIYVLSSLSEGGPYSIIEAMAAKLPIVSTNVFGVYETIARVQGNSIVPAGDPSALARGMKQMTTVAPPASLRQSFERIGQANYDYARLHYRQELSTCRTIEVYRALSSKREIVNLYERAAHGA